MRYLAHQTLLGVPNCCNPTLAAHQFIGILNEFTLWPVMVGRKSVSVPAEEVVDDAVRMFLRRYGTLDAEGRVEVPALSRHGARPGLQRRRAP